MIISIFLEVKGGHQRDVFLQDLFHVEWNIELTVPSRTPLFQLRKKVWSIRYNHLLKIRLQNFWPCWSLRCIFHCVLSNRVHAVEPNVQKFVCHNIWCKNWWTRRIRFLRDASIPAVLRWGRFYCLSCCYPLLPVDWSWIPVFSALFLESLRLISPCICGDSLSFFPLQGHPLIPIFILIFFFLLLFLLLL